MRGVARQMASLVLLVAATTAVSHAGQSEGASGNATREWPTYGGDLASTRYSPLDQIDASNFAQLEVAFRFKTDALGPRPEFNFQATPLMVNGKLFLTAGTRRAAVALDARTGELLWMHSLDEGERGSGAPRTLSGRGLAYWASGSEERVIYVTPGYQMIALDAKTGDRVPSFGENGLVDLKRDLDPQMDLVTGEIGLHAAPVISNGVIVVGAAHLAGTAPRTMTNVKGYVRGFDVRTGERLWMFHTIPRPGEFGNDTWLEDSWSYTGNTGSWAQMSIDEELGLVYVPVEAPTGDYYGGHRKGNNLFGESIVALDVRTGQRKWHYQLVHHGIWDHDVPCAPILADLVVDGRPIKALAQASKQGWVYVLNRETGEPVWPIEERPVPQGNVPGEWYSPTQPFVTKPPAFDRQGVSVDDLIDFTPALRAEAEKIAGNYQLGPLFTPPVVRQPGGPTGTLMLPALTGGANWPGAALDPETNYFYIFSNTSISGLAVIPGDPERTDMRFVGALDGPSVQGLPLVKPPYGRITALDLNAGTLAWQVAHGETPDNINNHPLLEGLDIPRTGRQGRIGVLVTKSLVIAGEGGIATTSTGERGAMLRAYDKATGAEVGAVFMPAPQTGSPMTYMLDGRQYLALSISGSGYAGELLVLRLPNQ